MSNRNPQVASRIALVALMSLGLSAGVSGVASAATHASAKATSAKKVEFHGVVTMVTGTLLTVKSAAGVSSTFSLATATKVVRSKDVKNVVTLAVGDRVEVLALSAAPMTALRVEILAGSAKKTVGVQGVVNAVSTTSITVTNTQGTSSTFTITSSTKLLRATSVKNAAVLVTGERVEIRAASSAPTVATAINILGSAN